ncbi:MAG: TetR/AcrR family transcriptional regulator [Lachnospiraceae bacterium]|nr:TetR/AcrR family transcriptional regulator [Lachnospiraceae bacterium]
MPKAFNETDKEIIREALLDAGEFLFIKFGIGKTTIEDLTKYVGIGKSTFYAFYNSKIDLYLDLYRRQREKLVSMVNRAFMYRKEPVGELITQYLSVLQELIKRDQILSMVYSQEVMADLYSKGAEKQLESYNIQANSELAEIVSTWEALKDSNREINYEVLAGMIRSVSFLRFHKFYIGDGIYESVSKAVISAIADYFS